MIRIAQNPYTDFLSGFYPDTNDKQAQRVSKGLWGSGVTFPCSFSEGG